MSNILDKSFRYVPAARTAEEGVLARWREQRKNMGESDLGCRRDNGSHSIQTSEQASLGSQVAHHNVKQLRRK